MSEGRCVVVLSGGMDSAVLLAHLLELDYECSALSIDYGQRHSRELRCAGWLADNYSVAHRVVQLPDLARVMRGSSQTDPTVSVPSGHYEDASMRATVVPNRNMILLSVAAAHAISTESNAIAYGAHAGDHAIYPDCRRGFVEQMAYVLQVCHYEPLALFVPFLEMDKGDIAIRGRELDVPFELTWTCYRGGDLACGKCGACQERLEAFAKAEMPDPLSYEGHLEESA